jgi:hypothetical protein
LAGNVYVAPGLCYAVTVSVPRDRSLSGSPSIITPPGPMLGPPRAEMGPNANTVLGVLLAAALLYLIFVH